MLYRARNEVIKFYDDYSLMASEAKNKAKNKTKGKGLKILSPKQFFFSFLKNIIEFKMYNLDIKN